MKVRAIFRTESFKYYFHKFSLQSEIVMFLEWDGLKKIVKSQVLKIGFQKSQIQHNEGHPRDIIIINVYLFNAVNTFYSGTVSSPVQLVRKLFWKNMKKHLFYEFSFNIGSYRKLKIVTNFKICDIFTNTPDAFINIIRFLKYASRNFSRFFLFFISIFFWL